MMNCQFIFFKLCIKFLARLHGGYNTSLALWKYHVNLLLQSFRFESSDLHQIFQIFIFSTDEDPSLRIECFATINLRGVSTKLN